MAMTDPLADMVTRIRNAVRRRHATVQMPASTLKVEIARVLHQEGFLQGVDRLEEGGHPVLRLRLRYQEGEIHMRRRRRRGSRPLRALTRAIPPDITVAGADGRAVVQRTADTRQQRALHGLVRNEIRNMIEGVTKGFERVLEINGVGYKAALSGRTLSFNLGFTHPIAFPLPEGIEAKVDKQTVVTIKGRDRYMVGHIAANIRALKKQ